MNLHLTSVCPNALSLYVQEFLTEDLNSDYTKLINTLADFIKDRGGEIFTVSLPYSKFAIPSYNVLCAAEVSSNMAKFTGLPFGKQKCTLFAVIRSFSTYTCKCIQSLNNFNLSMCNCC